MKSNNTYDVIHKDVIIIGNGPSGLALSYMLSGNIPYLISSNHPDEFLSTRLSMLASDSLVHQDLEQLSRGLEGRSTNPISLLLDALSNPYADIGFELEPLIEWRRKGVEIDHLVLGKGPPGGSWHHMDPHILTLSLGTWMALPGFPYKMRDGSEKRASAKNVANYYAQYMKEMDLEKNFRNGVCVTSVKRLSNNLDGTIKDPDNNHSVINRNGCLDNRWVHRVEDDFYDRPRVCSTPETEDSGQKRKNICSLSNALNFIRLRSNRKCKRRRDCFLRNELSPNRKIRDVLLDSFNQDSKLKQDQNISFYPNRYKYSCDSVCNNLNSQQSCFVNCPNLDVANLVTVSEVPKSLNECDTNNCSLRLKEIDCDPCTSSASKSNETNKSPRWLVEAYDTISGKYISYFCNYLVLANGASDLPNRLVISNNNIDPYWLVHDVRSLEMELDLYLTDNSAHPDPVLVIGAGLSAADAIIATRCRNIPVLHVFRHKNNGLGKQLPENMYPEYHKVHQMMQDGGSSYPLYEALPECTLSRFSEKDRTVTLITKSGDEIKYHVSFVAVLIGARPDLSFLPQDYHLGLNKDLPVDNKSNPIDISKLNHSVSGFDGLYAMGPLAGDNFVRFIPGGALAILSDLYKKYGY